MGGMTTVVEPVLPEQDQIRVTYIGPLSQWVFKAIVVVFVTLMLSVMFGAIMWGVVGPAIWKSPPPPVWWNWSVGLLLLALAIGLVKVTFVRDAPQDRADRRPLLDRRLCLRQDVSI
jgi:hypothetical protein